MRSRTRAEMDWLGGVSLAGSLLFSRPSLLRVLWNFVLLVSYRTGAARTAGGSHA